MTIFASGAGGPDRAVAAGLIEEEIRQQLVVGKLRVDLVHRQVGDAGLADHLIMDPPTERATPSATLDEYVAGLVAEIDGVAKEGYKHGGTAATALLLNAAEVCSARRLRRR